MRQKADLTQLPFKHENELDAGRYISAGVSILRERNYDGLNTGIYRHQVQGARQLGYMRQPRQPPLVLHGRCLEGWPGAGDGPRRLAAG